MAYYIQSLFYFVGRTLSKFQRNYVLNPSHFLHSLQNICFYRHPFSKKLFCIFTKQGCKSPYIINLLRCVKRFVQLFIYLHDAHESFLEFRLEALNLGYRFSEYLAFLTSLYFTRSLVDPYYLLLQFQTFIEGYQRWNFIGMGIHFITLFIFYFCLDYPILCVAIEYGLFFGSHFPIISI